MKIDMAPHSGVVAVGSSGRPFPVVGWCTYVAEGGGMVIVPLVLDRGRITMLNDGGVQYQVVGNVTEYWMDLVADNNAYVANR